LSRDSRLERSANATVECADLASIELAGRSPRIDPRAPERFVGVDISDSGERSLVEERCLDGSLPPRESLAEIGCGKSASQRLEAEARRQIGLQLVRSKHEPGSEPPDIAVPDVRSVV
jgi:hypothetical protein